MSATSVAAADNTTGLKRVSVKTELARLALLLWARSPDIPEHPAGACTAVRVIVHHRPHADPESNFSSRSRWIDHETAHRRAVSGASRVWESGRVEEQMDIVIAVIACALSLAAIVLFALSRRALMLISARVETLGRDIDRVDRSV